MLDEEADAGRPDVSPAVEHPSDPLRVQPLPLLPEPAHAGPANQHLHASAGRAHEARRLERALTGADDEHVLVFEPVEMALL
jgi:hypothetical protein